MSRSAFSTLISALELRDLQLLRLHLPWPFRSPHPVAQHRLVHTQIARSLHISYAALLDQLHSLKLELASKPRRSTTHLQFHQNT
jgi:hypothetical protein